MKISEKIREFSEKIFSDFGSDYEQIEPQKIIGKLIEAEMWAKRFEDDPSYKKEV